MDFSYLAIVAWIPITAGFFAVFRPVRALVLAYLIGWLALPIATIPIQGFWDVDKILATNVGVIIGALLFCPARFKGLQISVADIALLVFAGGTCITSLTNGLGVYDGVSSLTHKLLYYAVPFWFGRTFVRDRRDFLEACKLVVYGAAVYAMLAVWEWRMSPQIHNTLYGSFQHSWGQHVRWGFYRPIVCFRHALGLGMFFAWASLLAVGLQRAGQLRGLMGIPSAVFVALPLLGVAVSMSLGPWGLCLMGLALLAFWRRSNGRWSAWIPVAFALVWMTGRYTSLNDGQWMASVVAQVSPQRAESLQYRIDAETVLLNRAKQRPVFGWGGYGRNRDPNTPTATDGLWIILVGSYGLAGLVSFYAWWCWPVAISHGLARTMARDPVLSPLLIAIGLQAVNLLFNGFLSPVLTLLSGAAVTLLLGIKRQVSASQQAQRAVRTLQSPPVQVGCVR